jgi:hypothetical protein
MFRLEITKKLLGVTLVCAGTFFGVMGIAWSQVVFSALSFFINARYSRRFLDYGYAAQLGDFLPVLSVASLMSALVYKLSTVWPGQSLGRLMSLVIIGAVFFLATAWLLQLKALHDIFSLLSHRSGRAPDRTDKS